MSSTLVEIVAPTVGAITTACITFYLGRRSTKNDRKEQRLERIEGTLERLGGDLYDLGDQLARAIPGFYFRPRSRRR